MGNGTNPILLDYTFQAIGQSAFVFHIAEQNERLTNYVIKCGGYTCKNGWKVMVSEEPEINVEKKQIFLQGNNHDLNDKVDRHWNMGKKEIEQIDKDVRAALLEVVQAAKEWRPKVEPVLVETVLISPVWDPFGFLRDLGGYIRISK